MSQFVLDASVALAWVLDVPIPVYALEVRRDMLSGKRGLVPFRVVAPGDCEWTGNGRTTTGSQRRRR